MLLIFSVSANNSGLNTLKKVERIVQDEQGYIWLAGQHGLTRYDGKNTVNFSRTNANWTLPFTWIHDVKLDDNKLLVATETNKLWEFDVKSGQANAVNIDVERKDPYLAIQFQGYYYVYFPQELYRYNKNTNETNKITSISAINYLEKTNKFLYAVSNDGLHKFNTKTAEFELTLTGRFNSITPVKSGLVAINDEKIYALYDDGSQKSIPINHNIHTSTAVKNTDSFFVLTDKGHILKYSATSLSELNHNYPKISPIRARQLLHDSSEVLWIISNQGVERVSENNVKNHELFFDVATNAIEMELLNNRLLVGSFGQGIHNFSRESLYFNPALNQQLNRKEKRIMDMVSQQDDLYIATFQGLWHYHAGTKEFQKIDINLNDQVLLKLTLQDNLLYIATDGSGLAIYNTKTQQLTEQVGIDKGLSSAEVIDILPLDENNLWLATASGVDIYNRQSKTTKNLQISVPSKAISLVHIDNKVFASTKGDGILVFNRQGELLSRFALGIDFTRLAVIEGKIWAPAQHGIYKIDPKNYNFTLIPNTETYTFSDHPILIQDKVFAAHYGGILEIPVKNQSIYHPNVYISKTTISGKSSLVNKTINSNSSNDVITLEVASLDYRPGQEKQYKYRMNDGLWNIINGNQLTLTGMASGEYHLEIMATNSLGEWSNNKAYTNISVAYPWYWTPKVRVIYVFAALSLAILFFWLLYLRTKSISHIYHLLSNDIKKRSKVTLVINQKLNMALDALENKHETEDTKNLAKDLIKQSITELNAKIKANEPDTLYGDSLHIALPYFSEYIHKKYRIHVHHKLDINHDVLPIELQSDIYKIIYEAITSAILNSNGRNFSVAVKEFNEKAWLTISDDNDSFVSFSDKINFDMAIYYIRQIAKKYNASVNTFEDQGEGSQLTISFPLMKMT